MGQSFEEPTATAEGHMPDPPVGRGAWLGVAVTAVAIHAALWWLALRPVPKVLWGDEQRYLSSALKLLAGDPAWHPGFLWPPMYPRFVAGVLAAGGGSLVAVQLVQSLLLIAVAVVLHDLCLRVAGSRIAAATAAGLVAAYPPLVAFAHYLWPETLHLFLFVAMLWALVARPTSIAWGVVAGVALGLALVAKSLLIAFVPVVVVAAVAHVWAVSARREWTQRQLVVALAPVVMLVVAAALTIAPAVTSTYRATGRLMIANSASFNLWVGLNDRGRTSFADEIAYDEYLDFIRSGATFSERDRLLRQRIRDLLRQRSPADLVRGQLGRQYFRLFDKGSYLTEQLPGGAAVRQEEGYIEAGQGFAAVVKAVSYASYALVLVAAPLGFAVWRFRRPGWAVVLLLFVAYNMGLFFWLHVKSRYRVQLLPVLFIGCGCAVAWIWNRRRQGAPIAAWRLALGAAVGAVLLILAFAGPLL